MVSEQLVIQISAESAEAIAAMKLLHDKYSQTMDGISKATSEAAASARKSMDSIPTSAKRSANKIKAAYQTLGMESTRSLQFEIKRVQAAYKRMAASGKLGSTELDRAAVQTRAKVAMLRREITQTANSFPKLAASSTVASGSLKKVEKAAHGAHGGMGGMLVVMGAMTAAFAGWRGISAVVSSSMDLQSIMGTLSVGTSNAGDEFKYVSKTATELGLDLRNTAKDYARLTAASKGSELEGQATRDIFKGIATASVAMNLTADQTSGALKAIEQMMSKGNVQAEELRGQLGERLPGAFNLAADAMGVSTSELNKMLDRGEVMATDLLPALAAELTNRFAPAAIAAAQAPQAQFNRLTTEVFRFNAAIGENGATQAIANLSGVVAELFNNNEDLAKSIGDSLVNSLEYAIVGGAMLAKGFEGIGVAMDVSRLAMDNITLVVVEGFDIMLAGLDKFYGALALIPGETGQVYAQAQKDIQTFRGDIDLVKKGIIATGAESLSTLKNDYNTFGESVDAVAQKMFSAVEKARGMASVKTVKSNSSTPDSSTSSPKGSIGDPATSATSAQIKAAKDAEAQRAQLAGLSIERQRSESLSRLDMRRAEFSSQRQMGFISATEEIQALKALNNKTMAIELKAARAHAALIKDKPVAYQKAMDKIESIQHKHDLSMKKLNTKTALETKKTFDKMFAPITSAFQKSVNGMIAGTLTFRKAMKQMGQSIVLEFASMGVKMVVEWVKNEALKTVATEGGILTRLGLEESGSAMSLLISAGTAMKQIMMSAWQVMANVYNAIAAIPIIGPFIAPVAAAGAFAVVAGYASNIASASGGYDIPAGVNPMTQLHQQEMVLPAHIANPLRDMVAGGGSAGGNTTIVVQAMDARSFKQYLTKNASSLPPALKKLKRNFSA